MKQEDFVGDLPKPEFKDIRNTKPFVAEEKARLALMLGDLVNKVPMSVRNGSVDQVRLWKMDREVSFKAVKNPKSSVNDLQSAISRMLKWK